VVGRSPAAPQSAATVRLGSRSACAALSASSAALSAATDACRSCRLLCALSSVVSRAMS
jgi:hypothetical protein